jgi:3-deoxy-D-manno-octulosonic-acid transferase
MGDAGSTGARIPEELRPIWRALHDTTAFTVVAGSTWPADERVLLAPVSRLRRDRGLRLVIAPHEPTASHLEALERRLDRLALRHTRLGALLAAGAGVGMAPDVVVVDRMGVLADLYALADVAYVGGGFGRAGLHSVVEPAAIGVPVLFGPAHGNAREAGELASHGGGFVVASGSELEERLRTLADDPGQAVAAGDRAREYVRSGTGSAARNAELVLEAIGAGSTPAR